MKKVHFIILALGFIILKADTCNSNDAISSTGATKATTHITLGPDGNTVEQDNIINRLKQDNTPGSIKHLYIISPFTGDVLLYSTVKGKVTSSGKRLSPAAANAYKDSYGVFKVGEGANTYYTNEVLDDNGSYGSSSEYIYWWDSKGVYHQHFPGQAIVHISSQPLVIKKAIINIENPGQ